MKGARGNFRGVGIIAAHQPGQGAGGQHVFQGRAFARARACAEAKPRVILCDTRMAKGVPFLEARESNHFLRVEPHEWREALAILDAEDVR